MSSLVERLEEALSEIDDGNAERADDGEQPIEDIEVPTAWLRSCVRALSRVEVEGLARVIRGAAACDATGEEHHIIAQGRYRFCSECGETIRGNVMGMAEAQRRAQALVAYINGEATP